MAPDPHDTLAILAEVAVALAGFSGIVIAFGQRSGGVLGTLERRRLANLFTLSGMVLAVALLGVALLHLELADRSLMWRWASGLLFLCVTPWLVSDLIRVVRLEATVRARLSRLLLSVFYTLAAATLALQVANALSLAAAWPFFLGLVVMIIGAFQQFILLVRMSLFEAPER